MAGRKAVTPRRHVELYLAGAFRPKALWERFDGACEKAYAPAAKYFAELNAQRKQARHQREQFIAQAAAHAPTLVTEPRDWRAMERWLRETEHAWRATDLGSLEPRLWKKLDAESDRMKLVSIGKTAEGRDQWMAIITSPANHARLEQYRDIAARLARAEAQVWAILSDRLRDALHEPRHAEATRATLVEVGEHRLDPYAAADRLLKALGVDRT